MVAKRKKAASKNATPSKKAAKAPPKAQGLEGLFLHYADQNEEVIGPEGIELLCNDLGISPSDRRVLILAYIMGCDRMGYFSKQQFYAGCQRLHAKTLAQLKKALPQLDAIVSPPPKFHSFYSFAFRFCLNEGQKILERDTAVEMLQLVLPEGRFVSEFCEYLTFQSDYRFLNMDQWINFLKFSIEVREDMSNAGDNPAWPLLIDNFVEWHTSRVAAAKGGER
ncbi:hypothetical protein Ndes2526A_g06932 [Nannochloris sp. 'desiccata']